MAVDTQKVLLDLQQQPGNNCCADCGKTGPQWASYNIGVFLCEQCAGIHRSLGPHISKVKSLTLDNWDSAQIHLMETQGNNAGKEQYEQMVPAAYRRPEYKDPHILREQWILAKYARLEFQNQDKQTYLSGTKEGYLWKQGKEDKKFQRRRFVLSEAEGTLKYFNKENKPEPKAVVRLDTLDTALVPHKMQNPTGMQIMFNQEGRTRNIFVYSPSAQELIEWYTAIRAARLNRLRIAYPGADDNELVSLLSSDFLKEGWLSKTGPRQGDAFRRRWVSLLRRKVMYYEDPMDAFPKGEIFLGTKDRGFTVRSGLPQGMKDPGYCFTLKTPDRHFHFSAETDDERNQWVEELQQVLLTPMSPQDSSNLAQGRRKRSSFLLANPFGKS